MILRYIINPRFHDNFEFHHPFESFGRGRRHRQGRKHAHDGHGQEHEHDAVFASDEFGFGGPSERSARWFAAFEKLGGGGSGGGRGRRGGFRFGRKIGAADLQVVVLSLLAQRPSYGYEIIKALEEKTGGFYVPSPGMIYPALTYLEDLGYATVEADGARKRYSITDEGRAHLARNRASLDAILEGFARIGARMDDVRRAMGGDDDDSGLRREIHEARHALRAALHGKRHCSAAEAKRIGEILERAAREIADGPAAQE